MEVMMSEIQTKLARRAKPRPSNPKPDGRSGETKAGRILKLLQRKKGASITDLREVTGWQAHSVRGFLSGTIKKRLGLALRSEQLDSGERRYHVTAA
jgi:hypothetical protein